MWLCCVWVVVQKIFQLIMIYNVYDFLVVYVGIDVADLLDIHRQLMVKNNGNGKYLKSIIDTSVIAYDETKNATDGISRNATNTIPTNVILMMKK